jgi:hypothetical protein
MGSNLLSDNAAEAFGAALANNDRLEGIYPLSSLSSFRKTSNIHLPKHPPYKTFTLRRLNS